MSHPGIVSILTTGETIEGRPFLHDPLSQPRKSQLPHQEYHDQHPNRLKRWREGVS